MHPHKPPERLKLHGPGSDYQKGHDQLLALLDDLVGSGDSAAAAPLVEELSKRLKSHFAEEEGPDGVFTWLAACDATLGPVLRELEEDHEALSAEMQSLVEQPTPEAFKVAAKAFAAHVKAHEAKEHAALDQALGD